MIFYCSSVLQYLAENKGLGSLLLLERLSNALGKHPHHHHVSSLKGKRCDVMLRRSPRIISILSMQLMTIDSIAVSVFVDWLSLPNTDESNQIQVTI